MNVNGENITVCVNKTIILDCISFSLEPSRLTFFLGKSGSGKTTLLRCLAGLQRISFGNIIMEVERKIGFVSQSLDLFPHMSALQNCVHPQTCVMKRSKKEALEISRELFNKLDLSDIENKMPSQLSGGEKQRLAIARVLSMNVDTILFDEPTSALDPYSTEKFGRLVESLKKEGFILAISTHDLEFIKNFMDRSYLIYEKKIVDFYDKYSGEINKESLLYSYIYHDVRNENSFN